MATSFRVVAVRPGNMVIEDPEGLRWVELKQLQAALNELGDEGFGVVSSSTFADLVPIFVLAKST
jgi:hypothetical protein